MFNSRIKAIAFAFAATAGLTACTGIGPYGGTSIGVGYGNAGYGYGSPYGYGYGSPYGYGYGSPYGYRYGSPYGYAGYPYFGWYDGFYYPGTGYWVYDPYGNPRPITEKQKSYWGSLLEKARAARGTQATSEIRENWSGFSQQAATASTAEQQKSLNTIRRRFEAQRKAEAGQAQIERRQVRAQQRQQQLVERQQVRAERQQVRAERQQTQSSRPIRQRMEQRQSTDD